MRGAVSLNHNRRGGSKPVAAASDGDGRKPQTPGNAAHPGEQKLAATSRAFAILNHLAAAGKPLDVLDIVSALKLPKATTYRMVDWFITQGYLAREPGRKRLIVGPRLADLAVGVLLTSVRNDVPHLILQRLVHTLNETCNIGTMADGEIIYLDRVEAEHWPLRLHYTSGARVPLHCSAIGKLFLALAPTPRRHRLLRNLDLRRYTENTITDRARLECELREIAKERISFDRQEFLSGVFCAAVPVVGGNGEICAAIAVQAPEMRMSSDIARAHLPELRRAASELGEFFRTRS